MATHKKTKYLILIAGIATLIACACICLAFYFAHAQSNSIDDSKTKISREDPSISFSETGMLIQCEISPCFAHVIGTSGNTIITISNDGTAEIESIPEILWEDKEVPCVQFMIEDSDMAMLKNAIKAARFMTLEEDVTDLGTCDGGYYYITVYTTTRTHTSGGLNPVDAQFILVKDTIWHSISEDVWRAFSDEESAYYYDEEYEYVY